jgi:hypothetical protein
MGAAERSDVLQTRDRQEFRIRCDPGSAVHHCAQERSALHRIRETGIKK